MRSSTYVINPWKQDVNGMFFETIFKLLLILVIRGGSRAAATSKMERYVIKSNGFQPLTIIKKRSILDVSAVLDPPLVILEMVYCI